MPTLANPQPMTAFDPSKVALLHESVNDQVMEWNPERADEWRWAAHPHCESVHWNGYVFDAWSELQPGAVRPSPTPSAEDSPSLFGR
jgi:hypothetical protein